MKSHWVTLTAADGAAVDAFVAVPGAGPAAGVIVLQEIFGVNAFVRQVVERLAEAGYTAIAPDLFSRQERRVELDSSVEVERDRAMQLMAGLDQGMAISDAITAGAYLRANHALCDGRVGAVGYCLGGRLAYLLAARGEVQAAVGYYGVGIEKALAEMSSKSAPMLLHVAGDDHLCPPAAQQQITTGLRAFSDRVEVTIHDAVGHGFARTGGPAYNPTAARRADAATLAFLSSTLRG